MCQTLLGGLYVFNYFFEIKLLWKVMVGKEQSIMQTWVGIREN